MASAHRPYAGKGLPSVTSVIGMLEKPLAPAAARETAAFVLHHPDKWEHLEEIEALTKIAKHYLGVWDGRKAVGTIVHKVIEDVVNGVDLELGDDLADRIVEMLNADSAARLWNTEPFEELYEKILGYVLGVQAWFDVYQPRNLRSEIVVRKPGLYVGTADMLATITGRWPSDGWEGTARTLLDFKTTARQEEDKGIYLDSFSLQCNAYANADEEVQYKPNPKNRSPKWVEAGTKPWVRPDRAAILHLRGDEHFGFYEIPLLASTQEAFEKLASVYTWRQDLNKQKPLAIGMAVA